MGFGSSGTLAQDVHRPECGGKERSAKFRIVRPNLAQTCAGLRTGSGADLRSRSSSRRAYWQRQSLQQAWILRKCATRSCGADLPILCSPNVIPLLDGDSSNPMAQDIFFRTMTIPDSILELRVHRA